MKAAAFGYARAASIDDALALLASHGDGAKVLSGGQSLMPAMNLRLIAPELLVDIGGIEELKGISVGHGVLRIGALTRHADLQHAPEIAAHAPLLAEAVAHVAHPAIRNRGTLGGSLAHADPAAELPACMLALDATIVVQGDGGERRIAAIDFFKGVFQTALSAGELLTAVEIPFAGRSRAHFFCEFARRHGDYAIAGLAAQAAIEAGFFTELKLAYFAVGDRPLLASAADRLVNVEITAALVTEVSELLGADMDPPDDQQASPIMRRHLAQVLLERCIARLLGRSELAGAPS